MTSEKEMREIVKQRRRKTGRPGAARKRFLVFAGIVAAVALAIAFIFVYPAFQSHDLTRQFRAEQQNNKKLEEQAERLRKEAQRLSTTEGKLDVAHKAGLVHKNEIPIVVITPTRSARDEKGKQQPSEKQK